MIFIDESEIVVASGDGGNGIVSFKTARNKPKLGPDGGNGGNGGDIIAVGNSGLNTLSSFRYIRSYKAEHGGKGGVKRWTGKSAPTLYLLMPIGTIVKDMETGEILGEITEIGQELLLAKGGKRGYGNAQFVTATRQAPQFFIAGEKGVTKKLALELKLFADVGLAGFPNAGKSTLLSSISAARPKIADYPFTTLTPQLGVVELPHEGGGKSFVMADIPGLIEGASQGKGLGLQFLRHLERTKMLAFILDLSVLEAEGNPENDLEILRREMQVFDGGLMEKPWVIVLNKMDLFAEGSLELSKVKYLEEALKAKYGVEIFKISAAARDGLNELIFGLYRMISPA